MALSWYDSYMRSREQERLILEGNHSIRARLEKRTVKSEGCWEWCGSKVRGYGQIRAGGTPGALLLTHRVALLLEGVQIGDLDVDHMCMNRSCVRPDHLRVVTRKQNLEHQRGARVDSQTGVRGVSQHQGGFKARVKHHGVNHQKTFRTIAAAEAWATAKRAELFTHDDGAVMPLSH